MGCINKRHLDWKTQLENARDKRRKREMKQTFIDQLKTERLLSIVEGDEELRNWIAKLPRRLKGAMATMEARL